MPTSASDSNVLSTDNGILSVSGGETNEISVYSLQGRLVRTSTTNTVDGNGVTSGVYLVKVKDNADNTGVFKTIL